MSLKNLPFATHAINKSHHDLRDVFHPLRPQKKVTASLSFLVLYYTKSLKNFYVIKILISLQFAFIKGKGKTTQ